MEFNEFSASGKMQYAQSIKTSRDIGNNKRPKKKR